jgi:hypothetical protein
MAQCNFSIQFGTSAGQIAEKARTAIMGTGGTFQGDDATGNFDVSTPLGTISGSYVIRQQFIYVTIHSKPFLVSCSLIEKQLRGYFATMA